MKTYYLKISSCVSKNTFKYYFEDQQSAFTAWKELVLRYGEPEINTYFELKEILTPALILRTTFRNNPLTVIVKSEMQEEWMFIHTRIMHADLNPNTDDRSSAS